jgi:hypothetical protein
MKKMQDQSKGKKKERKTRWLNFECFEIIVAHRMWKTNNGKIVPSSKYNNETQVMKYKTCNSKCNNAKLVA